ncbi:MAG TPA: alpha/beta fold hydrolase [Candidatus Deferrimicrobium sp.]|nr:alpha/beta fold hydrolase [Candidatus Deferrimicrobium sp.]
MIISVVIFLLIIGMSCVIVGVGVYLYIISNYHHKAVDCEVIKEERFKIPIETKEGTIELEAKLLYSKYVQNPSPCVIVCHGWGSSLDGPRYLQEALTLHGFRVVAYSARGHGRSGGKRIFPEIYEDFTKVLDFLFKAPGFGIDPSRMAVIGHSMGGSTALLKAYLDGRVKLVVAMSTVHDVSETWRRTFNIFSIKFWVLLGFRLSGLRLIVTPEENLWCSPKFTLQKPSKTKVFLIHAKDDAIVEFDNFQKNVDLLKLPPDQTLVFERGGHSFFHLEWVITSQIIKWLNTYL